MQLWRRLVVGFPLLLSSLCTIYMFVLLIRMFNIAEEQGYYCHAKKEREQFLVRLAPLSSSLVAGITGIWLLFRAFTFDLWAMANIQMWLWLLSIGLVCGNLQRCEYWWYPETRAEIAEVLEFQRWHWEAFGNNVAAWAEVIPGFFILLSLLARFMALERESLQALHVKTAAALLAPLHLITLIHGTWMKVDHINNGWKSHPDTKIAWGVVRLVRESGRLFAAVCVAVVLHRLLKAAQRAPSVMTIKTKGRRALRFIRNQSFALFIVETISVTFGMLFWKFWPLGEYLVAETLDGRTQLNIVYQVMHFIMTLSMTYYSLALSGVINGSAQGARAREALRRKRKVRRNFCCEEYRKHHSLPEPGNEAEPANNVPTTEEERLQAAWEEKVHSLAHRGIKVATLIDFFMNLKLHMEHFDPKRSTTSDVVRGAIIPMTATGQCAAVDILEGEKLRPNKMVTHNWSNLFRDLVAAIAADALEETDFALVSSLLIVNPTKLKTWVEQRGTASRTYWVCAFAVNQHLSICDCNPQNDRDTVTHELYRLCPCGMLKASNSTPPVASDGRSIECEMNKFDDMIQYLAATDVHFEQVVAIDKDFDVFTRAWCVAEIAEASKWGMKQNLKIWSESTLELNREQLSDLRVQEMQASRKEDVQYILSKIENVDEFNFDLRRLLLEELLPNWSLLDGHLQMVEAGQVLRWCLASTDDLIETCKSETINPISNLFYI